MVNIFESKKIYEFERNGLNQMTKMALALRQQQNLKRSHELEKKRSR